MNRKEWIFHFEFLIVVVLATAALFVGTTREIPVDIHVDAAALHEANRQLESEVHELASLHELYQLNHEELRRLATNGGLDRLSSEQAIVGRVFYIAGEPFFYYVSLKEYEEAEDDIKLNFVSEIDETYIRPLTADIEFLARQFKERYPDKTERALAILSFIQNLGYDENYSIIVKHPTVTLMRGGVCIDLVIACGALLKAADINCAILIFRCRLHAAIGISDIDFEKFKEKISEKVIVEFEGRQYLICETTSLRHPAGTDLNGTTGPINAEVVDLIIPYEFP